MADRRCDDRCGCPVPCPGGVACRCRTDRTDTAVGAHTICTCGEHCSCNPCSCGRVGTGTGVRKATCTCGRPAPVQPAQPRAVSEKCYLPHLSFELKEKTSVNI